LLLALLIAAFGAVGYALFQTSRAADGQMGGRPRPLLNHPAPDFAATALDGTAVTLRAWRGGPVWINFWATWCPPCKAEMPLMAQKYQQHQAEGLVIVGINLQESPAAVRAWTQGKFHRNCAVDTPAFTHGEETAPAKFLNRAFPCATLR